MLPLLRHNVHSNISQAALKRELEGGAAFGGEAELQLQHGGVAAAQYLQGQTGVAPIVIGLALRLPTASHAASPALPSPAVKDAAWAAAEVGGTLVTSLDWADRAAYADPAFKPPYDFILAADCVYSELAGGWVVGGPSLPGHRRGESGAADGSHGCAHVDGLVQAARWFGLQAGAPLCPHLRCMTPREPARPHPTAACLRLRAVPHLLATVLAMGGPRTQTIVTNEFRSQVVWCFVLLCCSEL